MPFGKHIRSDFILDDTFVNIDNASLPVVHRHVYAYSQHLQYEIIKNQHIFYKQHFDKMVSENKRALADKINADVTHIALTTCTTDSMNAILRTLALIPGDEILIDEHAYISHRRMVEFVSNRGGARMVKVYSPFPIWKKQGYVDAYIDAITPRTRLVILEDICSAHGLQVPIEPIIDCCRSRRIQVLVAGSNAFATRNIDVGRLGANWYVGSCHKWGLAIKGAGFIWAKADSQNIRPTIISKYNHKAYPDNFSWVGAINYTPWLTIAKGLAQVAHYQQNGSQRYCKDLMVWAKAYLSNRFNVTDVADDRMVGNMGVVVLPAPLQHRNISHHEISERLTNQRIIAHCNRIYDKKILRLSADIFNTKDDYIACADAIDHICSEV